MPRDGRGALRIRMLRAFILNKLKRSVLTAVCASCLMDFGPKGRPGDARDTFLHWLTAIDAQLEKGHKHRVVKPHRPSN